MSYDIQHTDFSLPALTLQPIVENAVKHGTGSDYSRLEILIHTEKTADESLITVEDNGPGFTMPAEDLNKNSQTEERSGEAKEPRTAFLYR